MSSYNILVTASLIKQAKNLESTWFNVLFKIKNPLSKHSPEVSGELSCISELSCYLEEELKALMGKGIEIEVELWKKKLEDSSLEFIKEIDEKNRSQNNSKRLFLFTPERIQYSIERLKHYTATNPKDFQRHIILTNYDMYLDNIVDLTISGEITGLNPKFVEIIESERTCQMRTIHFKKQNGMGITVINIWVWPSNAKNITDHLAVLRPKLMLMLGHAGGLRNHQRLGDFVLADKFITDCWITKRISRQNNPLPVLPTFNVNRALYEVLEEKSKTEDISYRLGTVFTTEDRNWELSFEEYKTYFDEDRSVAIDMESAIIAAQGFKYKIPNATLLMVSDKPFHGELKKEKESLKFYAQSKEKHVRILLETIDLIKENPETYLNHSSFGAMLGAKDDSVLK